MDIVLTIVYAVLILGFLVFIHEGGHYLAARAFGVRVTEFIAGRWSSTEGVQRKKAKGRGRSGCGGGRDVWLRTGRVPFGGRQTVARCSVREGIEGHL